MNKYSINSEADASELLEYIEKCFFITTLAVMFSEVSNLQPHTGV